MYGQTDNQEKQKKRIVIASLVMGIIIIILIGVLINAITSKNRAKLASEQATVAVVREDEEQEPTKVIESTNTEGIKSDEIKEEEGKPEDSKLDPVSNDPKENATSSSEGNSKTTTETTSNTNTNTTTTTDSSNLPTTGPTGAIGLAFLAGTATSYALSRKKKF